LSLSILQSPDIEIELSGFGVSELSVIKAADAAGRGAAYDGAVIVNEADMLRERLRQYYRSAGSPERVWLPTCPLKPDILIPLRQLPWMPAFRPLEQTRRCPPATIQSHRPQKPSDAELGLRPAPPKIAIRDEKRSIDTWHCPCVRCSAYQKETNDANQSMHPRPSSLID
jgi:hypothetical protein